MDHNTLNYTSNVYIPKGSVKSKTCLYVMFITTVTIIYINLNKFVQFIANNRCQNQSYLVVGNLSFSGISNLP